MSKDNFVGTAGGRRELYQKNKYYGRKRFLFWWVKKKTPAVEEEYEMKEEYDFSDSKRGIGHMIQPSEPWPRSNNPVEIGIKHEAPPMEKEYDFSDSKVAKATYEDIDE